MDGMTGRFGTGTMHAVFQAAATVFVEKHALNMMQKMQASACLEYSWCSVILASGFVGIHVVKCTPNLVLASIEHLKSSSQQTLYSKHHESAYVSAKNRASQND